MADVDHPKTHVEDQDLSEPRVQPESPQREGIDPLTEGDTMYPAENTKDLSEKLDRKQAKETVDTTDTDTLVADQEEVSAKANTPNANLPDEDKTETSAEKEKAEAAKPAAPADAKKAVPAKPAESPSDGSGAKASK